MSDDDGRAGRAGDTGPTATASRAPDASPAESMTAWLGNGATPEEGFEAPLAIERESAEGVMRAVTAALAEPEPLRAAFAGGSPFSREFEVFRGGDSAAVTIIAPAPVPPERSLSTAELVARLHGPPAEGAGHDGPEELETWRLESELLRRFALDADPPLPREMLSRCHYTLEIARDRFDRGIVGITPDELGRIVFEDVPRELDIDPLAAHRFVEVLRDLFRYIRREAGLARAEACAASLDDVVVRRLEEALADPDNHGPAKTARMAVRAAGLEPGSAEAEVIWTRAFEQALLDKGVFDDRGPVDFLDPPLPLPRQTPAERKARRKKRKVHAQGAAQEPLTALRAAPWSVRTSPHRVRPVARGRPAASGAGT